MTPPTADAYGQTHAPVYDRIYGARFVPDAAVAALSSAAGAGGSILELGLGTGRLAIPLAAAGLRVDGIESSTAMAARLRAQPGGDTVRVIIADLADFEVPGRQYDVAVCAVSTLFMLPDREAQQRCVHAAARHLRVGGRLFIEAFRLDESRFDAQHERVEERPDPGGDGHVVRSVHDPRARAIRITHELTDGAAMSSYDVVLRYLSDEQLDAMAAEAGLRLVARWDNWTGRAAGETSSDPISVYERTAI
ncbi:class I SAM-dependent methyltransferase [Dermatophilaceae bacterium Sec6.4]